ncbi:MAG TPA: hypothetical protein PLA68_00320 [Panacibacter sp.]|nr:hypothetical protein [Panacibacter sp.]
MLYKILFTLTALLLIFSCSCKKGTDGFAAAIWRLEDSSGICASVIHGEFYAGIQPDKDSCYILVSVNVTQTGSYKILTGLQNGMLFYDSGFFNNTGIQMIRLKPSGTPVNEGTTDYAVNFNSGNCSLAVNINNADFNIPENSWRFVENDTIIHSGYTTQAYLFNHLLIVGGSEPNAPGNQLTINLACSVTNPVGSYHTSWLDHVNGFSYTQDYKLMYRTDNWTSIEKIMQFSITKFDISAHKLWGLFYGQSEDPSNPNARIIKISKGAFKTSFP